MKSGSTPSCGQATLELAVILIALAAVIVGVISVSSLVVKDNRRLLEAKYNAEKASRASGGDDDSSGNSEIASWSYSLYRYSDDKSLRIPFLGGDSRNMANENILAELRGGFRDAADTSDTAKYIFFWMSPNELRCDFDSDYSDTAGNALDAAKLVRAEADGGSGGNDSNQVYMPAQ